MSNPPISMLGGCLPIFPALPLPSCCLWPWGRSCFHTHQPPELLDPSPRHCLAFSYSMADPFLHFPQQSLFGSGPEVRASVGACVCGAAPAPWPVISWECSLVGAGCRVPVMLLRIKSSICTQTRPIFFLSCSSSFAHARRDSLM